MIRLKVASLFFIAGFALPVYAQEHVVVGTQRLTDNGALFLAAAEGYFRAEGLDLGMTAFESDQSVVEMLASGTTDFGLAGFTPAAFNFAGKGVIKAIAAQAREKRYYEGTELVASNVGFAKGMRKFEDVVNKTIAIDAPAGVRYQLEQIAASKTDFSHYCKADAVIDAIARAVGTTKSMAQYAGAVRA